MSDSKQELLDNKQKIINAALVEFAEKGYEGASTNKIVEEARVSKGVLFYHFGDKEGLYTFLFKYVTEVLSEDIISRVDLKSTDTIDLLKNSLYTKMRTLAEFPLESKFYSKAFTTEVPPSIKKLIQKNIEKSIEYMNYSIENFDESLLREGLEKEKVMKHITWACKGLIDDYINYEDVSYDLARYEAQTKKIDEEFDFMKKLFYKEGK